MIRQSFVAVHFAEGAPRELRDQVRCQLGTAFPDLEPVIEQEDLVVLSSDGPVAFLDRGRSIVLGTLHSYLTSSANEPSQFSDDIANSRGDARVTARWGNYVGFIIGPGRRLDVIRAPFGDLPCYIVEQSDCTWFASDIPILSRCGAIALRPDVTGLVQFLLAEDICHPRTGLDGVRELLGGQSLSIYLGRQRIRNLWTPWNHVVPVVGVGDQLLAMGLLRATIVDAIGHVTQGSETILLRLSGGLDSSILAAALKANARDVVALNLVTKNPAGDERDYARYVARHLGISLVERFRSVDDVDITLPGATGLPRPSARSFAQSSARLSSDVARDHGATLVVDGGGGDQLFCSLVSARIAADCLADKQGRGRFWSTCAAVARLAEVSVLTVARRAWAIHRRLSARIDFPVDLRFLTPDLASLASDAVAHPWLDAPAGALPGKAAHVAMLLQAQTMVRGALVDETLPLVSPLWSQPIVEACLRIPTWQSVDGGRDRAVARRAFAAMLPAAIIDRAAKGSPDSFVIELYDRNRAKVRAMLLDGQLAALGLLDREALRRAIDRKGPVAGVDFYRIMRLVDAEAWLGSL